MPRRTNDEMCPDPKYMKGMGWRVGVSIVSFFGLLIAIILWLFFYAANYNAYQNVAIFITFILAFAAINGATWAPWGMRQRTWIAARNRNR